MSYVYVARTKPKAIIVHEDPWDGIQLLGGEIVHEPEDQSVDTGLVNVAGTPLYRIPVAKTIGFNLTGKSR